jgi:hypothetical protein
MTLYSSIGFASCLNKNCRHCLSGALSTGDAHTSCSLGLVANARTGKTHRTYNRDNDRVRSAPASLIRCQGAAAAAVAAAAAAEASYGC